MKKKVIIFSLVFLMFFLSLVSSSTLENYKPQRVDENFSFCQTCENANYITLSNIKTPNSTELINANMTSVGGGSFCYNYTPTQIGTYDFAGISDGCLKTFAVFVPVTADGNIYDTGDSLIRIFVAIFFIVMIIGFYRFSKSLNYDKWFEDIKNQYITKNAVKWALGAIGYIVMKQSSIVYFLLGLPIMIILMDLIFIYNITSITLYMQSLLYLYIAAIILLGIVFIGFVQEWFIGFFDEVRNMDWGVDGYE